MVYKIKLSTYVNFLRLLGHKKGPAVGLSDKRHPDGVRPSSALSGCGIQIRHMQCARNLENMAAERQSDFPAWFKR